MVRKITQTQAHKDLTRRYLLWFFKSTKESFERIERKTTQLKVDEYVLEQIKTASVPVVEKKKYDGFVKEFEAYITAKSEDELKLKFSDGKKGNLDAHYIY